jgi:hypothetical protein
MAPQPLTVDEIVEEINRRVEPFVGRQLHPAVKEQIIAAFVTAPFKVSVELDTETGVCQITPIPETTKIEFQMTKPPATDES